MDFRSVRKLNDIVRVQLAAPAVIPFVVHEKAAFGKNVLHFRSRTDHIGQLEELTKRNVFGMDRNGSDIRGAGAHPNSIEPSPAPRLNRTGAARAVLAAGIALGSGLASAQEPTFTKTGFLSREALTGVLARLKPAGLQVPEPVCAVDLFRVHYPSTDVSGRPRTLSALLAVPHEGPVKGWVLYCHGTLSDRTQSPSRYRGIGPGSEPEIATAAFAAGGYALAMPDYLGLGDDPGVHPYPLNETNAQAGIDLMAALRRRLPAEVPPIAYNLYVTGYSEGGGIAMWTVRKLEEAGGPLPVRAAPMSGAYDLTETMTQSLLRGRLNLPGLGINLYLLGYSAYSAASLDPAIDLRDYFAPSFASYIPFVFRQGIADDAKARKLVFKALQLGAFASARKVLTFRFREALKHRDVSDPIFALLRANDIVDWAPRTPMILPYLENDGIVPAQNTLKTLAAMRARGVGEDVVRGYPISAPRLNHITAAPRAISAVRAFFDSGFPPLAPASGR